MSARSEDDAVLAAERRLTARTVRIRNDWHRLKGNARAAATGPLVIGASAALGALVGSLARARARRTEPPPSTASVLRMTCLAVATPIMERALSEWLTRLLLKPTAPAAGTESRAPSLAPTASRL